MTQSETSQQLDIHERTTEGALSTHVRPTTKQAAPPPAFLTKPQAKTTDQILGEMAQTFKERNAVYGDNYRMVSKLMAVLFPHGVPSELVTTEHFHLFELKLVKLSRFAISNLTHMDSIHDDAVYSAMIESILTEQEAKKS